MRKYRCSICQKVSSAEIATNVGDFKEDYWTPDPIDHLHYICGECDQAIREINEEFDNEENVDGW